MKKRSLGFFEGMLWGQMQPLAKGGMKFLDWERAKQICLEHPDTVIYAGLCEDWDCTNGMICDHGKFVRDDTKLYDQSRWATPILDIDGEEVECWTHEPHDNTSIPDWWTMEG